MTDYLQRALQHLGASEEEVLAHSLGEGEVVIVLDKGIKGCPKYRIALDTLPKAKKVAEMVVTGDEDELQAEIDAWEDVSEEDVSTASYTDTLDIKSLSYRDLQAQAKYYDIPANQSKDALIEALLEVL